MSNGAKTREYVRPIPSNWWLKRPAYTRFIVRELSSAFLGGYAIFLTVLLARSRDPDAWVATLQTLRSPLSIALHVVALFFALFHSVTFFNLTPRVLVLHRGEEKVPDGAISGAHYAAWAVVSAVLLALALRS